MIKIAFLNDGLFEVGGVQRVVAILSNALIATGRYEVSYICVDPKTNVSYDHYNLNRAVRPIVVNYSKKKDILWFFGGIYKRCAKKIKCLDHRCLTGLEFVAYYNQIPINRIVQVINENDFDIVVGVQGHWALILAYIAEKIKCKTIGWQHNCWDAYFERRNHYYWRQNSLFNKYLQRLDQYVALNQTDAEMIQNKFEQMNAIAIPNPRSFVSGSKSKVSEKCILFAGRIVIEHKGLDYLIQMFQVFHENNPEWMLRILGEGDDLGQLKHMIDDSGASRESIELKNFTNNVEAELRKASMVVMPSRWEGMPMFALEALEMGVPIIASNISAFQNIITEGKQGFLCEVGDITAFSERMTQLAQDDMLRKKMSLEAVERSKDFEIDHIVKMWDELFKKLLCDVER